MRKIASILLAVLYTVPLYSQTREWHIKDNYVDVVYMGNDLFKVKSSDGKWGIINEYGRTTVNVQYDSITSFVEKRALLLDASGKYLKGIVDEKGQIIKSFYNNEMLANYQYFNEGMLAYGVPAGSYYLFGYMDLNGNTVIQPKYYWAAPFFNGKAVIQYTSANFGIIDKTGGSALYDNRTFLFMGSMVDDVMLIAVRSGRQDKIMLARLEENNKLKEVEVLETGAWLKSVADDYKSIRYNNGTTYYFDEAMRLVSSSSGEKYNDPIELTSIVPYSSSLKALQNQDNWEILYDEKTVLQLNVGNVVFYDNKYAAVTSVNNNKGVLKLNDNGNMSLYNVPSTAEFYHNNPVTGYVMFSITGLQPSSQVQIGVVGIKEHSQEDKYYIPAGFSGIYNLPVSYFIPSETCDKEEILPLQFNFYIDGMLYKKEHANLKGVHKQAFRISEAIAPEYSDVDGKAYITFNVRSLDAAPSSSARVTVSGAINDVRSFRGEEMLTFKIPVTVPSETVKAFAFTVKVEEKGCPAYTRNINSTIKHYDLQ